MSRPEGTTGIRRRLLIWLLAPLALLLLVSVAGSYRVALSPAVEAYDHQLSDTALVIAARLHFGSGTPVLRLSANEEAMLRFDGIDRIYFAVRDAGGSLLAGDANLPPLPWRTSQNPGFYDGRIGDAAIRGALYRLATPHGEVSIQVAETTDKREQLTRRILSALVLPFLVFGLLFAGVVTFGVRAVLAPLQRLRSEVQGRRAHDLHPLPEDAVPVEVQPLILAINRLLSQVADSAAAEQRFLSNAAHQLRTPLAALQTQLELADMETDADRQKARLRHLRQATERVSRLVQQLLALARAAPQLTAGQDLRPVDLREVVEQFASSYVDTAIARDIDLGYESEHATVTGAALLLRELLANLVDNALKYTPAGGHVTVRTGQDDDQCILEVEDDGPGIPADQRDKVFDRFYRPPGSTGDGCGLGLAIVREIAELHGGRVEILDARSARGTRVRVTFPAAAAA